MLVFKKNVFVTGCFAILTVVGCANEPHKVTAEEKPRISFTEEAEGRAVTNAAAVKAKAHNFVEIQFKARSSSLTKSAMDSLAASIEQAKKDGKIDEVLVLSWSDEEYPSKKLLRLPKRHRELAKKRNEAIGTFIRTYVEGNAKADKSMNIETYNMAEQPKLLSKWFNTNDSKLKESLLAAGLPTTADELQYPSKASHSVILIKVE